MSNTRKETCPHCDGCGYVEVPAPKDDAEPITVNFCDVYDAQDIAKVEARIERRIKSITNQMSNDLDSNGNLILPGHIIECAELPEDHAEKYHLAFAAGNGLDIRDLGNNNSNTYFIHPPFYVVGPYWLHLDKLDDDDLERLSTTRGEAKEYCNKYMSNSFVAEALNYITQYPKTKALKK